MLVLRRNLHETVMIGDDIEITVVNLEPGAAKIGIVAPQEVPVHRKEIYDQIKAKERTEKI